MNISILLNSAHYGELPACSKCHWSPMKTHGMAFGISCIEHGVNWELNEKAVSMSVLQDPGNTTPQETGRLCTVHNSRNLADRTAQHDIDLWKATVSLDSSSAESGGFLKRHYWTNAIMHGASKEPGLRKQKENVRRICREVLAAQVELLTPKVIIAEGVTAVNSLFEIGLLDQGWKSLSPFFDNGAYRHEVNNWHGVPFTILVFCTFHPSVTNVNTHIAKRYNEFGTEKLIQKNQLYFQKDNL